MNAPTVSPDLVAKLVLNPLRNAKDRLIFGGNTLNGVMDVYTRLGHEERAERMASALYELADCVQIIKSMIQQIEAETR